MTLYHKPGWSLPNGHVVRSHMEASLCEHLASMGEPHLHGTPETHSFEVTIGPRRHALYVPSIVLTESRHGQRVVFIEPIDSPRPGGGVRRLLGFRQGHYTDYFLVVVARRVLHHQIVEGAYDLLVPLEDFYPLDAFLRSLE
jgi:hypothetical protein